MTTRTFPAIKPNTMSWALIANSQQFVALSGAIQTAQRPGQRWTVQLEYAALVAADRAVLQAFVVQVLGQADNFTLSPADHSPRGAFGGTPRVNGTGQTGNSLSVDGCSASVANWVRAGDFFQVGNELKMATEDASSNSAGQITLSFVPELRAAPADETVLIMGPSATGVFRFTQPRMGWSSRPPFISSMTLECVEDITA